MSCDKLQNVIILVILRKHCMLISCPVIGSYIVISYLIYCRIETDNFEIFLSYSTVEITRNNERNCVLPYTLTNT